MSLRVLARGIACTCVALACLAATTSSLAAAQSAVPSSSGISALATATKTSPSRAGATGLGKIDGPLQHVAAAAILHRAVPRSALADGIAQTPSGAVEVSIYFTGERRAAEAAVTRAGVSIIAVSDRYPQRVISGIVQPDLIPQVAALANVRAITSVVNEVGNVGSAQGQNDLAHQGPVARGLSPGASGMGVVVGIVSDSINRVGVKVAGSQASGDLPADVQVLSELENGTFSDEGRAMAEVVYDGAPGINRMLFHTGFGGAPNRAAGIDRLVASGARVIVDDVVHLGEPFFQDGIVSQAADRARAAGVLYVVSAGNRGRQSWEGTYSAAPEAPGRPPNSHDFDRGPGVDVVQTIGTFTNKKITLSLQWDEPWTRAETDLAVDVYSVAGDGAVTLIGPADSNNITSGIPSEVATITLQETTTLGIGIRRKAGTRSPFIKYVVGGVSSLSIAEHATGSPAIDPDGAAARGALAVGAVNHGNASAPTPQSYSSRGPLTRLFDVNGNRLAAPDIRTKPDVAGADGITTSIAAFSPFVGTSAAAPSVGAVAALVISAKPALPVDAVWAILTNPANARSCGSIPAVRDNECGAGFILADRAVSQALDTTPPRITPVFSAPPDTSGGAYRKDVTVTWNVQDDGSPVYAQNGCGATTVATVATHTVTCTATSAGGTAVGSIKVTRLGAVASTAGTHRNPRLWSVSARPAVFSVNVGGRRERLVRSAARRKPVVARGTTLKFRASERGRIRWVIHRRNKRSKFVKVGAFDSPAKAGGNSRSFSGRIGKRSLAPGKYFVTAQAYDSRGKRKSAPVKFTIRIVG